jgi:hypothetical protein
MRTNKQTSPGRKEGKKAESQATGKRISPRTKGTVHPEINAKRKSPPEGKSGKVPVGRGGKQRKTGDRPVIGGGGKHKTGDKLIGKGDNRRKTDDRRKKLKYSYSSSSLSTLSSSSSLDNDSDSYEQGKQVRSMSMIL